MTNDEVLVRVENVSKKFCRSLKKSLWYGVKDMASELTGRGSHPEELRPDEFWAVNDVSFELRRGECLGLIGRNGAGKTTLLKILNGLIKPDGGRVEMRGRIGALIALGAGFNPILSGRENIYVNASILGIAKREIDAKLNEIIEFAELRDFIDAPVQSYSSGMQVRLGFAIATALDPDVLILDEVLAVGDAAFRNKCYQRISKLRKKAAVIFVSHNMEQVGRICDSTLVMSKGAALHCGSIEEGIGVYEALNEATGGESDSFLSFHDPIADFAVVKMPKCIQSGRPLEIDLEVKSERQLDDFVVRFVFYNSSGAFAADCNFSANASGVSIKKGTNRWHIVITAVPLRSGKYRLGINLIDSFGDLIVWSYKQRELAVDHEWLGAVADCQLFLESWEHQFDTQSARTRSK